MGKPKKTPKKFRGPFKSAPFIDLRLNDDGSIDEILAENATVHLEQMDDGAWYLGIYHGAGYQQIWLTSKRPIYVQTDGRINHSPK